MRAVQPSFQQGEEKSYGTEKEKKNKVQEKDAFQVGKKKKQKQDADA